MTMTMHDDSHNDHDREKQEEKKHNETKNARMDDTEKHCTDYEWNRNDHDCRMASEI